jgi:hypothetical protein
MSIKVTDILHPTHLPIALGVTLLGYFLGANPIYCSLIISAWWASREVTQAEYRYIHIHTKSKLRKEMPLLGGFDPKVWNIKSFVGDMLIPFIASLALALYLTYIW